MSTTQFQSDSHYASRGYLTPWRTDGDRVWTYRLLVSHASVRVWEPLALRSVARHSHLYTRVVSGRESDDVERWFNKEIETPAAEPLRKAIGDDRLTLDDWMRIVRFVAAQDVRTPARLQEEFVRWQSELPAVLQAATEEGVRAAEASLLSATPHDVGSDDRGSWLPMRVTVEPSPDGDGGTVRSELVLGRGLWLHEIRHLLQNTAHVLRRHKWTILKPPAGSKWFTSDDPVIRLNFHSRHQYDFRGGWGSQGTEILCPLSPQHLLYTRIGYRPPHRGSVAAPEFASAVRRCIAEHAHRMIFADLPTDEVVRARPRSIDAAGHEHEQNEWRRWTTEQTAAERELQQRADSRA
ncbi:MAG: DUF4238 domain-containing protein [Planctomycetota bacterium]